MNFRGISLVFTLLVLLHAPRLRAEDEASCSTGSESTTFQKVDASSAEWTSVVANLSGYKSEASVSRYMQCYNATDEVHKNWSATYEKKYRKLVKAAADATGIPFSILACLFFRESRWNTSAVSSSNAIGLAQLLSGTWTGMVGKINTSANVSNKYVPTNLRRDIPRDGGTLDRQMAKIEKLYKDAYRNGAISGKANLILLRDLLASLKSSKSPRLKGVLAQYQTNVRTALDKIEIQEAFAKYTAATGKKPSLTDRTNPDSAIIIGATYLKTIVFKGIFGTDSSKATQDHWIIATGGYNTGPGNSPCDGKMSADQCIEATVKKENKGSGKSVVHESSNHMKAIRNCSDLGNTKPMPGDRAKECTL